MHTVRVVLAGMPALVRDLVRVVLETEPDLRVVAELTGEFGGLADGPADVVVCSADNGLVGDVIGPLLNRHDPARLVIIAANGRYAYLCTRSGELSA
jgi:DNA-binding NarL/FixJ family response regulator